MTPQQVAAARDAGAVVLDMRLPRIFARAHVPGAVNLQFNRADLADRAEMILPQGQPFIVHAEPEALATTAIEILEGAGFEVAGHLQGGLAAWRAAGLPVESITVIGVDDLHARRQTLVPIDARDGFEYRHGHVPGAVLLPWTEAWARVGQAPAGELAVICGDEVRSALVASILQRAGRSVQLVVGGMVDWNERGYAVEKEDRGPRTADRGSKT
jgi:hydroxyacylglutathione hydrolase